MCIKFKRKSKGWEMTYFRRARKDKDTNYLEIRRIYKQCSHTKAKERSLARKKTHQGKREKNREEKEVREKGIHLKIEAPWIITLFHFSYSIFLCV